MKIDGNIMSAREAVVESMLVTVLAFANSSEFRMRKYPDAMHTAPCQKFNNNTTRVFRERLLLAMTAIHTNLLRNPCSESKYAHPCKLVCWQNFENPKKIRPHYTCVIA